MEVFMDWDRKFPIATMVLLSFPSMKVLEQYRDMAANNVDKLQNAMEKMHREATDNNDRPGSRA